MSNRDYVQSVLSQNFTPIRKNLDQDKVIAQITNVVQQLTMKGVKIISVVGGAASGKTTIAEELVVNLQKDGLAADMLSTDNYAVGDREYRQIKLKDADAQKKYDFELMDKQVSKIRKLKTASQSVAVPEIDSETGIAADLDEQDYAHQVGKVDILVIEGDFPRDDYDLRFYVHVPDTQRLENNIARETDAQSGNNPGQVTSTFNDRQRTLHKPYTLPALQSADYVLVADVTKEDWLYTVYQRAT